jgi:hypothetical protein
LNFEESFNFTTTLLHAILIDRFFPGQPWAFAGTTDSEALNFKESFNLTTTLLHSTPVDKFFPGQPCAYARTTKNEGFRHRKNDNGRRSARCFHLLKRRD